MRFRIVAIGRPRDRAMAAAIAEYERRAASYWPLEVLELREGSAGERSAGSIRRMEGERILDRAGAGSLIACDERGRRMTSPEFAAWLQRLRERARDVSFAIGGSWGLDERVLERAEDSMALAPWTLQHELARLVLAEQFYRAGTIIRGEPYHR